MILSSTGQPPRETKTLAAANDVETTVTLVRFAYAPHATLGRLVVEGEEFFTIEKPWRDNQREISCIPEGAYPVISHDTERYPNVWEVTEVPDRDAILIHVGNWVGDVQGCIAVGCELSESDWMVTNSGEAIARLREILPENFTLVITQYAPEYP